MVTVIRPSRARCVKARIPRRDRAVLTARHTRRGRSARWAQAATERRLAQLSSLQKRILCDRRHIADAVAELLSHLSIVPHMRSSDVPPKYSAPLTRGIFFAARLPVSSTAAEPVAKSRANLSKKAPLGRAEFLGTKGVASQATRPNWADENGQSGRHHVTASGTISRFPHLLC